MQYVSLPDSPTTSIRIVIEESDAPPAINGRDLVAISEIEVWAYGED